MAKYISNKVANKQPVTTPDDKGTIVTEKIDVAVDAALAAGDLILFTKLPNGCRPCGGLAYSTDIDTNGVPAVAMTFGFLNDAGTDLVANTDFLTASVIGQAGTLAPFNNRLGLSLPAENSPASTDKGTKNTYVKNGDRVLAAKITTVAATPAAGTVSVEFQYTAG